MAGFAVLYQPGSTAPERNTPFLNLIRLTAQYKCLAVPETLITGKFCTAAKCNAPSSLHREIARDERSGSWLMTVGTVVALAGNNDPHALLGDLLMGFLEKDSSILDSYDGHFGLVFYNGLEDSLSIISDPLGLFAIYYARQGANFFCSTSALAIARQISAKPDELTIECFLRTGRSHGDNTLWQDVKRIKPGTIIKLTRGAFEESEYWSPSVDLSIAHLPLDVALEQAKELISKNFQKLLGREGKVWADLTGGFDTRVTTIFLSNLGIPFVAWCMGPSGHPDVEVSHLLSKEMGWEYRHLQLPDDWREKQFSYLEPALGKGDGLLDVFQLAGVLKCGQDRSFASYASVCAGGVDEWRYHVFGAKILVPELVKKIDYEGILDARIVEKIPIKVMSNDKTREVRNEIIKSITKSISGYSEADTITKLDIAFLKHRHPTHTGAYLSALSGLIRSLAPFCFKELVNFGLSFNHHWRIRYHALFIRHLIELENPRLAAIQTAKGEPAASIRISNIHKYGPLCKSLINNVSKRASHKLFKKQVTIFPERRRFPTYPLPEWRVSYINWAVSNKLLEQPNMYTGSIYKGDELKNLIMDAQKGISVWGEFLERVITIEMAMRTTTSYTL